MSTATIAPPPLGNDVDSKGGTMTQNWADWIVISLLGRLQKCPTMQGSVSLTNQNASVALTPFNLKTVNAGIYRVGWTARVTTAAAVNSSLSVTIGYSRLGIACTQTSSTLATNATNLPGSGIFTFHVDGNTPIEYQTTYASTGVPAMVYELDLTCENVA